MDLIKLIIGCIIWYLTHRFIRKENTLWDPIKNKDAILGSITYGARQILLPFITEVVTNLLYNIR